MPLHFTSFRKACAGAVVLLLAAWTATVSAIEPVPPARGVAAAQVRLDARFTPPPVTVPFEKTEGVAPEVRDTWARFRQAQRGGWKAYVDRRSGRVAAAEGAGIAWIPGRGNKLTAGDVAPVAGESKVGLATLERLARRFLETWAPLLGVDPATLVLDKGRSAHPAEHLWYVDFNVQRGGLPIEGARVVFRVSHGNLVQFGSENLPPPDAPEPRPRLSLEQARARLDETSQGLTRGARFVEPGSLRWLPVAASPRRETGFRLGTGRGLLAVWQFVFTRPRESETWLARIDAVSGELLELHDTNRYAQVSGGAFPNSPAVGAEHALPMPFADLSSGGYTDSAGQYAWGGGAVTSTLNGQYVLIDDDCGAISQSSDAAGHIAFGVSSGTDCTTPGSGGTGNTHAARTQFYHVNRAKEAARTWLPGVAWLDAQLEVNVNINNTCNAYWSPGLGTLNFYRSGGGCGNTGEIAGVALHEYGHGLDSHDGNGSSPDYATGETYGDITGVLATRASCIGPGFRATNCSGYGDACTSCTGVRDIDWALHASGAAHTVANFTQVHCPAHPWYVGPCNREGHCESYVLSEALWDFVARDLPSPGSAAAWTTFERLWYLSRPTAGSGFTCDTSGAAWTSDGCAVGSYWRALRAADDDDGDLDNGTPHACALFAAFDRHGMACATDLGANTCFSGCAPPAVPTMTLTPGGTQVTVSWTSSGAGNVYDVYRSESGCATGLAKVANDVAGTSYVDAAVAAHGSYSYQVLAHPAGGEACASAPSACAGTTPGVDVWSRDRTADTGLEPDPATAGQAMWESQDIWVRNDASAGSHQNPIAGQANWVHARVRNRGAAAGAFNVEVYFADASTGLAWPAQWTLIGTAPVAALAGGADTEVTVNWTPTLTGHFCLVARLVSTQDPMTYAEGANISVNTRNNNNVVWKNVIVIALSPAEPTTATLLVPNPGRLARRFRLEFEEVRPRELLRAAPLVTLLQLDVKLGPREAIEPVATPATIARRPALAVRELRVRDIKATALPVSLRENEVHALRLTFRALPAALRGVQAPYLLRVRQIDTATGELVGGLTYEIHFPRR